jgi:signal transduction histidine kinase
MHDHFNHHQAWHQKWHASPWRRLFFVSLFSGLLSFILWGIGHHATLDVQLVYAYGTGLSIWFLTDIVRQWFFPPSGAAWSRSWAVWFFITGSICIGFILGTLLGDWYSGWSTFDLLQFAPQKLAGLIVMCIAISTAFITFFYQQNRLQVAEQQATESKLQLLQSQLEPHMLFNTLANLRALIDVDALRAQSMLDRLIDYLRATLGASRVTSHALSLEFDRLEDYLALMQIRMGTRLSYQLDLPDSLKAMPCPALLLQPLVENAVLHGLEPTALGGHIAVTAMQQDKQLVLTVSDTGAGFAAIQTPTNYAFAFESESKSASGFGLTQLRERLSTLYGINASVVMASQQTTAPIGTCVTITIPLPTGTPSHETNFCRYC